MTPVKFVQVHVIDGPMTKKNPKQTNKQTKQKNKQIKQKTKTKQAKTTKTKQNKTKKTLFLTTTNMMRVHRLVILIYISQHYLLGKQNKIIFWKEQYCISSFKSPGVFMTLHINEISNLI